MTDDTVFESLAHYASGMATVSFCVWTVILYKWRKRNRMTYLLFLSIAYITLSFIKDAIFLIPSQIFSDYIFAENIVSIFDMSFLPIVCAFFIETTRPGTVTNTRLAIAWLAFIAFLPLYCVSRANWVLEGSFLLSALMGLVTVVAVSVNVVRYNKYISDNYSFTKNISVGWCIGCALSLFLSLLCYELFFYEPTWFGEMAYDISFVVIWNIVCLMSRRHHIVDGIMAFDGTEGDKSDDTTATETPSGDSTPAACNSDSEKDTFIASALQHCMEAEKLYLNTRLSLAELAVAVGTNKTYISNYINAQGSTFYDYVNGYRIEEACRIIDESKAAGQRIVMADVAARSGFNSTSTFNRYFFKLQGITPTSYSRKQ